MSLDRSLYDRHYRLKKPHNVNQLDENSKIQYSAIENMGWPRGERSYGFVRIWVLYLVTEEIFLEHQAKKSRPSTRMGKSCWRMDRGDDMGRYLSGLFAFASAGNLYTNLPTTSKLSIIVTHQSLRKNVRPQSS